MPLEIFKCIVKNTPLVSIDLIVENNGLFLLGKRINEPAKGFYFVPGGRILKNEKISQAFKRITKEELGQEFSIEKGKFLGIYEHFYENSFFDEGISTHYVVLAYKIKVKDKLDLPFYQHNKYVWLTKKEILESKEVHNYTKVYFGGR
nr:GDP-mannose mannosyl hydrolase [Persephonella atlantica]